MIAMVAPSPIAVARILFGAAPDGQAPARSFPRNLARASELAEGPPPLEEAAMRSALPYLLAGVLLAAGLIPGAVAQERTPPQSLPTLPPAPPGGSSGPSSGSDQSPRSPSEELNHSGGVLKPPPTPDAGVVSPPSEGSSSMPVIPPPGTPGGNPKMQPK
jgi:hypothetical protein